MILVKSDRTNSKKCKIRKFDLDTQFGLTDGIRFVDPDTIPANTLYKMASRNVEELNKRLERCRLIARSIECAFNRTGNVMMPSNAVPVTKGRVKGKFIPCISTNAGIFVH